MKTLVSRMLLLTACFASGCSSSPNNTTTLTSSAIQPEHARTVFPEDWLGTWSGPAANITPNGEQLAFSVSLEISPIGNQPDRLNWIITYELDDQRQTRPYQLIVIDAEQGLYAIDERNSILLDCVLIDDTLYSDFEIGSARLIASYRLDPNRTQLHFEIVTTGIEATAETGGEDAVPTVKIYRPFSLQRAILTRH